MIFDHPWNECNHTTILILILFSHHQLRGPRISYLDTTWNAPGSVEKKKRLWSGSKIGFSEEAVICTGSTRVNLGSVPVKTGCSAPSSFTGHRAGEGMNFDFLNYHISDPLIRVVYIPPPQAEGRTAVFNVTSSRMTQAPYEAQGPPIGENWPSDARLAGYPIGARVASVDINMKPSDDHPDPTTPIRPMKMSEDEFTVLRLGFEDADTPASQLRAYITEFPAHGRLYQIRSSSKQVNTTFEPMMNASGYYLDPSLCETAATICKAGGECDCRNGGNCDAPVRNCYYVSESFVLGEPVSLSDQYVTQRPTYLLNSTSARIVNASTIMPAAGGPGPTASLMAKYIALGSELGCYNIDRFTSNAGEDIWSSEPHCDFVTEEIVPSACRRCTFVPNGETFRLPKGGWSGRLIYQVLD